MLTDAKKEIQSVLYERISNPFLMNAAITWSIVNFEIILMIFSSVEATKKIRLIKEYATDSWLTQIIGCNNEALQFFANFFIVPAVFSALSIWAMPGIYKCCSVQWEKGRTSISNAVLKERDKILITEGKASEIMLAARNAEADLSDKLKFFDADRENWETTKKSLECQVTECESELIELRNEKAAFHAADESKEAQKAEEEIIHSSNCVALNCAMGEKGHELYKVICKMHPHATYIRSAGQSLDSARTTAQKLYNDRNILTRDDKKLLSELGLVDGDEISDAFLALIRALIAKLS